MTNIFREMEWFIRSLEKIKIIYYIVSIPVQRIGCPIWLMQSHWQRTTQRCMSQALSVVNHEGNSLTCSEPMLTDQLFLSMKMSPLL